MMGRKKGSIKSSSPKARFWKYVKKLTPKTLAKFRDTAREKMRLRRKASKQTQHELSVTPTSKSTREDELSLTPKTGRQVRRRKTVRKNVQLFCNNMTPTSKRKYLDKKAEKGREKYDNDSSKSKGTKQMERVRGKSKIIQEKLIGKEELMCKQFETSIAESPNTSCYICKKLYFKDQVKWALPQEYDTNIFTNLITLFMCCSRCDTSMKNKKIPCNSFWNEMIVPPHS